MTGGLIQLASVGSQNFFLNSNPLRTFFKEKVETHTHFSMESKTVIFNRNDTNIIENTKLICTVPRYGDLISDIYFCFNLPDLYYNVANNVRPKWIREVGLALIDNISVTMGGGVVDRCYGEWLSIYNSLTMPASKVHLYNKMIGNVVECFDPDILVNQIDTSQPFVKGRLVVVPLSFWFTKNPGCALPLISMQYEFVTITVELRPMLDVYLVNVQGQGYVRPQSGNNQHALNSFNTSAVSTNYVDIDPYLEVNYVFLDDPERNRFVAESQDYLLEQLVRIEKVNVAGTMSLALTLQNPVKEMVFVARDVRVQGTNDWLNFTNVDDGSDIIQTVKIMFNGFERLSEKPIEYFKYMQVYKYHTSSPRDGIYVYSFSLRPEEFQPSGECNMSKINKVQMLVQIAPGLICDVVVYATNYNFLRVASGMAGVAFA